MLTNPEYTSNCSPQCNDQRANALPRDKLTWSGRYAFNCASISSGRRGVGCAALGRCCRIESTVAKGVHFVNSWWVKGLEATPTLLGSEVVCTKVLQRSSSRRNKHRICIWRRHCWCNCPFDRGNLHTRSCMNPIAQQQWSWGEPTRYIEWTGCQKIIEGSTILNRCKIRAAIIWSPDLIAAYQEGVEGILYSISSRFQGAWPNLGSQGRGGGTVHCCTTYREQKIAWKPQ